MIAWLKGFPDGLDTLAATGAASQSGAGLNPGARAKCTPRAWFNHPDMAGAATRAAG